MRTSMNVATYAVALVASMSAGAVTAQTRAPEPPRDNTRQNDQAEPRPTEAARARNTEARNTEDRGASPASDRERLAMQQILRDRGYYDGELDGVIGPRTRRALREFQRWEGIAVTGVLDRETARALGVGAGEVERVTGARPEPSPTIRARGPVVRRAQETLTRQGFHSGAIDGILGPETDRAIRDFQRAHGLTVDGVLGPETLTALGVEEEQWAEAARSADEQRAEERRERQQSAPSEQSEQPERAPTNMAATPEPSPQR